MCCGIQLDEIPLFQAMNGFLLLATQTGKLLYISDNAAEYLGHSMVSDTSLNYLNQINNELNLEESTPYILSWILRNMVKRVINKISSWRRTCWSTGTASTTSSTSRTTPPSSQNSYATRQPPTAPRLTPVRPRYVFQCFSVTVTRLQNGTLNNQIFLLYPVVLRLIKSL